jgi:hypothetical protein
VKIFAFKKKISFLHPGSFHVNSTKKKVICTPTDSDFDETLVVCSIQ